MKEINVLSLFDGISVGRVALERLGIPIKNYYASEIDKYAIKIAQKNYPSTIQLGDVYNYNSWNLEKIDLMFAGFCCQSYSVAGKQLGIEDIRGQVIYPMLEAIKKFKPKYILLENVKGILNKKFKNVIDLIYNELKDYNLNHYVINSALVSAQNRQRVYFTNIEGIEQPEDKHIYLKDIIEHGIVDQDKSYCIDANYWKGGNLEQYFDKKRRQPKVFCVAQRGRYDKDGIVKQQFEINKTEKTNTLTGVQKDNYCLKIDGDTYIIRKLTPTECERLQTLDDGFTEGISDSQRYKCLGNGWTVDVISHILSYAKF